VEPNIQRASVIGAVSLTSAKRSRLADLEPGAQIRHSLVRLSHCVPVSAQREMENGRSQLVSIPLFGRGFSRHQGLPIRCHFRKSAKDDFRARLHRLDETTRLSPGMVASPQSPLPFHLVEPVVTPNLMRCFEVRLRGFRPVKNRADGWSGRLAVQVAFHCH
jgi:hypothetical protein